MICQFSVKNYKSIKEELTLDMQATAISEHVESVITDKDGEQFLPLAAIYGPNGGGKSNVLGALNNLLARVMAPICAACPQEDCDEKGKKVITTPFKFSLESKNKPTEYELFFRTKTAEYQYCLHLREQNVVYESLKRRKIDGVKYSDLYKRDVNKEKLLEFNGAFKKLQIEDISDNLPLISYLAITNKKNPIVYDIIKWFEFEIDYKNYGDPIQEMGITIFKNPEIKKLVLKMIKEMDMDIDDYLIEEDNDKIKISTIHNINGIANELDLIKEESSGTIKIFGVVPYIARSLVNGTTLVVDELDAKIHPQLLKYIIQLYRDSEINKKGAQLIFTSHDLSTMTSELFRRDEIWFVSKSNIQDSQMYSLVEFKMPDGKSVRKDARFDKQYLEGKYGADPYLKRIIDWEDINGKEH